MENSRHRQLGESMQQFRGRLKRELNAANDALQLQVGEPVRVGGGRAMRFHLRLIDRMRPSRITRLEGDDLAQFLAEEAKRQEADAQREERIRDRNAFYARPEVQDADAVRALLEDENNLRLAVTRLSPQEWADLRKRLE